MSIAYHYCTLETAYAILSNRSFYLTDIYSSNDSMEIQYQLDLLLRLIKERDISEELLELNIETSKLNYRYIYALCLCYEPDLLTLWTRYANDGKGVAIGLDLDKLNISHQLPSQNIVPRKCVGIGTCKYNLHDQEQIIQHAISYYLDQRLFLSSSKTELNFEDKLSECFMSLKRSSPVFKHPSFADEREVRILFTPGDVYQNHSNYLNIGNISIHERNELNGRYYHEMTIDNDEIFKEIIIGPKNNISSDEISSFLLENNLSNIDIKKSNIPYRNRVVSTNH